MDHSGNGVSHMRGLNLQMELLLCDARPPEERERGAAPAVFYRFATGRLCCIYIFILFLPFLFSCANFIFSAGRT